MSNVEDILKPEKLDIAKTIKGKTRAEDYVHVYLDHDSVYKLFKLNAEMEQIASIPEDRRENFQARYDELESETEKLVEAINESKLTVHLRGLLESEIDAILTRTKREDIEDEADRLQAESVEFNTQAVHESITKLVWADGTEEVPDLERWKEIRDQVDKEWPAIRKLMESLSFAQNYFEEAVDAGFLQRR